MSDELKRLAKEATRHHAVEGEEWLLRIVRRDTNAYDERFIAAAHPAAVLASLERMRKLETALETIAAWDRARFPRVADRDRPGETLSYGYAYGGNGERDFMRTIAREALKP